MICQLSRVPESTLNLFCRCGLLTDLLAVCSLQSRTVEQKHHGNKQSSLGELFSSSVIIFRSEHERSREERTQDPSRHQTLGAPASSSATHGSSGPLIREFWAAAPPSRFFFVSHSSPRVDCFCGSLQCFLVSLLSFPSFLSATRISEVSQRPVRWFYQSRLTRWSSGVVADITGVSHYLGKLTSTSWSSCVRPLPKSHSLIFVSSFTHSSTLLSSLDDDMASKAMDSGGKAAG